jgi:hypothetical protein
MREVGGCAILGHRPLSPRRPKWLHRYHESRAVHLNSRFEQGILRSQSQTGGVVDGLDAMTGGVISGCLGSSEAAKSDRQRGRLARRGNRRPSGSGFHQRLAIEGVPHRDRIYDEPLRTTHRAVLLTLRFF